LDRLYGEVVVQWQPFRGEGRGIYAPIVDVAVGPFAIQRRYIDEYGQMLDGTRAFIDSLIERHNANLEGQERPARFQRIRDFNENARCLLCIEIEESGSRKHCPTSSLAAQREEEKASLRTPLTASFRRSLVKTPSAS
jgi:hypothetical protein